MRLILHWIILSVAVWLTTRIISGVAINSFQVALIVGACLTLFNMFIKPVITILTLPINLVTLGLFSLVINGLVFWYIGTLVRGFTVNGFQAAFVGALLVSIINWLLNKFFKFD